MASTMAETNNESNLENTTQPTTINSAKICTFLPIDYSKSESFEFTFLFSKLEKYPVSYFTLMVKFPNNKDQTPDGKFKTKIPAQTLKIISHFFEKDIWPYPYLIENKLEIPLEKIDGFDSVCDFLGLPTFPVEEPENDPEIDPNDPDEPDMIDCDDDFHPHNPDDEYDYNKYDPYYEYDNYNNYNNYDNEENSFNARLWHITFGQYDE
jgi:hypothetical protein